MKADVRPTNSRAEIRRCALRATPLMGLVRFALVLFERPGETIARAAILASVSAVGGLIAWAPYHAISRRNDGLAICAMATTSLSGMARREALPMSQELGRLALGLVGLVLISFLFGLSNRGLRKAVPQPAPPALWDADVDSPP